MILDGRTDIVIVIVEVALSDKSVSIGEGHMTKIMTRKISGNKKRKGMRRRWNCRRRRRREEGNKEKRKG